MKLPHVLNLITSVLSTTPLQTISEARQPSTGSLAQMTCSLLGTPSLPPLASQHRRSLTFSQEFLSIITSSALPTPRQHRFHAPLSGFVYFSSLGGILSPLFEYAGPITQTSLVQGGQFNSHPFQMRCYRTLVCWFTPIGKSRMSMKGIPVHNTTLTSFSQFLPKLIAVVSDLPTQAALRLS